MKSISSTRRGALLCASVFTLITGFGVFTTNAQQKGKQASSRYVSPPGVITGTVQGEKGPEAGVWVIAETKDLATNFIKIVVTDDQGRYVLPELPNANFKGGVRGYGLADSTPVDGKPGATLNLKATNAKSPQEAAKVY